jgi:hypothetical protein
MYVRSPGLERRSRPACAAALVLAILSPSLSVGDSPFPGLELVTSKNVAVLYRRPDVDASEYSKIMIGEPQVEFSKNWNPRNYGNFGLSAAQLKKIRVDLATLAKETFAQVLSDGGYAIVTDPADDALEITPNIINLYITAPDVQAPGRSRTYAMDAGSATLALHMNDAVTGTLLAVAVDSRRSGSSTMRWTTSVSNRAAASAMLKGWAEQLKRELDAARAK